jgi:hypothetical protein
VKSLNKPERDLLFAGGPELSGLKILELAAENRWTIVTLDSDQPMVPCAEELLNGLGAANIAPSASSTSDDLACRTFDAADHLLSAVRSGPPGRVGVAESLLHMEEDIFGERHFEMRRRNMAVRLVVLQDGRLRNEEITTSPITAGSTP